MTDWHRGVKEVRCIAVNGWRKRNYLLKISYPSDSAMDDQLGHWGYTVGLTARNNIYHLLNILVSTNFYQYVMSNLLLLAGTVLVWKPRTAKGRNALEICLR
ncbi:hypothetical protein BDY19DRAFT_901568 [Irpex rosettiformis]|uniref:Uncharacterized protein n=1 Tax=Irpex rosettiformis TaxID=378272 RepID=A0ACB8UJB5_9APHY|nr:hypothetical protein BDY19DRAFT_901568 [Irpex rosettiformis]